MVSLKDLMIGIANQFQIFVNKTFVNGSCFRIEIYFFFQILEDGVQSFQLFWIFCKEMELKSFCFPGFEVFDQQIKLPVECRLFFGIELNFKFGMLWFLVSKINLVS